MNWCEEIDYWGEIGARALEQASAEEVSSLGLGNWVAMVAPPPGTRARRCHPRAPKPGDARARRCQGRVCVCVPF